jgi:hypothetical protein
VEDGNFVMGFFFLIIGYAIGCDDFEIGFVF